MGTAFAQGILFGLVAAAHCAGMCGGFPLALAHAPGRWTLALRQLLYVGGKSFTYVFLGTLFAALGSRLADTGLLPQTQKTMAIAAGAMVILLGLGMLGVKLPSGKSNRFDAYEWGFVRSVFGHFLDNPGNGSSFLLGLATGFLPCPITLAMVMVAAASASVLKGMAVMAGLGLGTAPALLAIGMGGSLITGRWRRLGLRPAGILVVLLGAMTIARSQGLVRSCCDSRPTAKAAAPACACAECIRPGHPCPHCAAKKAAAGVKAPGDES